MILRVAFFMCLQYLILPWCPCVSFHQNSLLDDSILCSFFLFHPPTTLPQRYEAFLHIKTLIPRSCKQGLQFKMETSRLCTEILFLSSSWIKNRYYNVALFLE